MPVLSRSALESSPLADLHEIASGLDMDGYRRLRKADLVAAILDKQGGTDDGPADDDDGGAGEAEDKPARRRSRGGRSRSRTRDRDPEAETEDDADDGDSDDADTDSDSDDDGPRGRRRSRGGGNGRGRGRDRDRERDNGRDSDRERDEERVASGSVELLANGSGFVRLDGDDDDVYVSAAQVRRCELVDGDEVSGPVRPPRRSERHPSLARVDTINGRSADEVAEGTRFDDLPAAFPTERLAVEATDDTVSIITALAPVGRGSRVVITGPARSGKSETLRRLAAVLAADDALEVSVVLSGVRPEELADWQGDGLPEPAASTTLGAPGEVLGQAVERAADTARRVAARGGHAVLLVDSLEHVPPHISRRVLGSARDIVDGGSLTVIATAPHTFGGETTVITLDAALASVNRFPALDLSASGTLRPELLIGEAASAKIAEERAKAL